MIIKSTIGILSIPVICLLCSNSAYAGGLWMYERGTAEVGTANAGVAARAQDAATAMNNPAGMTRLTKSELLVTAQPLILNVQFDPNVNTTHSGNRGNADAVVPAAGFFLVYPLSEKWRFGFSVGSYFGLGLDYEDDWVGRYYLQEGSFVTADVAPTLAYRVNDWLSVGGGPVIQYAKQYTKAAINNLGGSDGELEYEDDSVEVGGDLGILIEPSARTRFGLTYVSEFEHTFKDHPDLDGIGPALEAALGELGFQGAEVEIQMTIPQAVMFSAYHELNDAWAIMGNIGWQDWSEFGQVPIGISSTTSADITQDLNFDDTWHFAVGAHYRFCPKWRATVGIAYDSSPVDDRDRTVAMPLDRQVRYSVGSIYNYSDQITMGATYTLLDCGDAEIDQNRGPLAGELSGDYQSNYVHIIGVHCAWRF